MGDRANFGFKQSNGTVYLYGHWAGGGMMNTLAHAIHRIILANRTNDEIYGTRIAISDIVGQEWSNDLGWGISVNYIGDNEHSVPVVDFTNQTVSLYSRDPYGSIATDPKFTMSFDAFIERFYKE